MDSSFSYFRPPRAKSHALGVGGVCLKTGSSAEARCYAVAMRYEKISITHVQVFVHAANVNTRVQATNAQGLGTRLNHSVVKISLFLQCYS